MFVFASLFLPFICVVEVTCPMHIDHGHLSNNCSSNIKASCDEVICDAGHTRNNDVAALVCNDEGTWDYEVSFLCDSIDNGKCTLNKNIKMTSFKSIKTFKRKMVGQTDLFRIINPFQ